jgi:hypothetical protein
MIQELRTFLVQCDESDCGAQEVIHSAYEHDAVEESTFGYHYGDLLCPFHLSKR